MPGFAILLGFNLLGLLLQHLGVPLPGSVIGLALFVACLFAGVVKLRWVEPAADLLLRNMLLFFAPVIVGAIAFLPQLRAEWPAVVVGIGVSTVAAMLSSGAIAQAMIRHDSVDPDVELPHTEAADAQDFELERPA